MAYMSPCSHHVSKADMADSPQRSFQLRPVSESSQLNTTNSHNQQVNTKKPNYIPQLNDPGTHAAYPMTRISMILLVSKFINYVVLHNEEQFLVTSRSKNVQNAWVIHFPWLSRIYRWVLRIPIHFKDLL